MGAGGDDFQVRRHGLRYGVPKRDPPVDRVRKLAMKLPDVEAGTTFGYPAFKVAGTTFAWFPKKKEVEDGSVAVRMGFIERDHRVATKRSPTTSRHTTRITHRCSHACGS